MSEQETIERAHYDKEQGKSQLTQAGEFVREEIHHFTGSKARREVCAYDD
jgi:hypothetical protein